MKLRELPQLWAIPTTGQLVAVHPPEGCRPPCPVHAPTDHPMRAWPMFICGTRLVRLCPHGVCHPDPDDDEGTWAAAHPCCEEHCCAGAYRLGC